MTAKMPPVPPASRNPKGPGGSGHDRTAKTEQGSATQARDPDKTGQSANTKVNTTHPGHQQDH